MTATDHPHDHADGNHGHRGGLRGALQEIFRPHSHDAADSIDTALEASERGVRAVKISFAGLAITAMVQLIVVVLTGSVALLADTIHNFSDALTAIPLFIAFRLGRRPPNRRFTYGYRRAEDLAGLFVIAMIALSAVVAAWVAIDRLTSRWSLGMYGERVRWNNDALYREYLAYPNRHDVSLRAGVRAGARWLGYDALLDASWGRRINYLFQNSTYLPSYRTVDVRVPQLRFSLTPLVR